MQGNECAPHSKIRIGVVGAGIIGSSIALELQKRGADVTLIDRDEPGLGCSYGNSGAISPGSVTPIATPGLLQTIPGMLLNKDGPLHLPMSYLGSALPWLLRFLSSARRTQVESSANQLALLHLRALELHDAMTKELGVPELFVRRGHLYLYPNAAAQAKDDFSWGLREKFGFPLERLDRGSVSDLEPRVSRRYTCGIFVRDHATIVNPLRYVQAMVQAFSARGGTVLRADVTRLAPDNQGWRLLSQAVDNTAYDHIVIAAGAWSNRLLGTLGLHAPLESQRGYHIQFDNACDVVSRTVVLADHKIIATPMEGGLRVGGTVEIGGLKRPPSPRRIRLLEQLARSNFDGLGDIKVSSWMGHRPCMPDSVPRIGASIAYRGLWMAFGHGHLGVTDSLGTAQRIADHIFKPAIVGSPN